MMRTATKPRDPADERVCAECGCVHGPGNTNRLCPLASNYSQELADRIESENPHPLGSHACDLQALRDEQAENGRLRARVAELETYAKAQAEVNQDFAGTLKAAEAEVARLHKNIDSLGRHAVEQGTIANRAEDRRVAAEARVAELEQRFAEYVMAVYEQEGCGPEVPDPRVDALVSEWLVPAPGAPNGG